MDNLSEIVENYLNKYKVEDIINQNSKILFILESPHTQEIKQGYPVAGSSGIDMTKFIYGRESKDPFGKIVSQIDKYNDLYPNLSEFSILNVSSAPMQKEGLKAHELDSGDGQVVAILEKLRVNYKSKRHKNKDWNRIKSILLEDFKQRLLLALKQSSSIEYLVPCGRFAEAYLDLIKELEMSIEERKIISEIPHPSFNQWFHYDSMEKLKKVLEEIGIS
ncbi:hypothetical protein BX659_106125 [Orenia metallireducens]|uniref:Uracil DNA glycosylase superfamily protein n=1 Tax=Orenia metallireducens TaxID=1413210 RepID=A0A285GVI2_9FIRM|nr:hypothetical protein [Orenia metallireducens]PRX31091.1 hypothetical protein BX659_106125 [Orenia metallireducens]SNY27650.1 hypothetical protein SAMN06265827_11161 [Orenia metallireducens]